MCLTSARNLKILFQGKGGVMMFGGCIADRVVVNEEEIALADVRGFATVQFSSNSVCRYVDHDYSILDICHGHHGRCPWRKNLPCGETSPHDRLACGKILHMTDCHVEKALHMRNVKKICNVEK